VERVPLTAVDLPVRQIMCVFLDAASRARPKGCRNRLRAKAILLKRFKLPWVVQSPLAEIFRFTSTLDRWLFVRCPVLTKGRFAIVTNVEAGCGGRFGGALTNAAQADGKVVWS
jgi:hypothetical protein